MFYLSNPATPTRSTELINDDDDGDGDDDDDNDDDDDDGNDDDDGDILMLPLGCPHTYSVVDVKRQMT